MFTVDILAPWSAYSLLSANTWPCILFITIVDVPPAVALTTVAVPPFGKNLDVTSFMLDSKIPVFAPTSWNNSIDLYGLYLATDIWSSVV